MRQGCTAEVILDKPKQQLDAPTLPVELGDLPGSKVHEIGSDTEVVAVGPEVDDPDG